MKRMLPWMITVLLALTLIALVVIMMLNSTPGKQANPTGNIAVPRLSADEIVEMTSSMNEIKTNLADHDYIVLTGFAFQLDSKKTKEQFDKIKDMRIKPLILRTLADMKPEELQGMKGQDQLCSKLLELINKQLPEGKVIQIDLTDFIMQRL
ncbi:flagellar basal body protein FliL [Paenibacillus sp. E194]|jgi:flagellar protein FliL|uniref:Flagellar protein FliL n=2 Tax=Paenibacillus alvei TaxID=44250 RepID=S9TP32_PAEAL|nr:MULTISPECIES: flagellar basal body-associated FliL family protein [Paenibacillus]EPY04081.1 flagellar basal body-associated protein flil [Paenibacillus alvei TS-15]KJB86081.1 flagellar basal body protein FliL [Paenibacillus sp. E194]MCM3291712.1 flagellar basal body-associated FliL family protein [Paenibacillus sp. MER 180]OBY79332.1 flagellar basal body protein FliL [Paenibacillus sp. KS1]SYX82808.1 Flagellar protein FliL [Paenibacillus alvei]